MSDRLDFFAHLVRDHARIEARLAALERAAEALSRAEGDTAALGVITGTLASPQVIAEMGREMRERTCAAGPSVEGLA
jgi:hypothetical protein